MFAVILNSSGGLDLILSLELWLAEDGTAKIFPTGVHWCHPTLSDLQGGVHLVRECPTEAIRHAEAHPTAHQRGPRRSKVLTQGGLVPSPLTLRVGVRQVDATQLYHGCGFDPTTMLNWTSFRAFERDHNAEGPHHNPTWR